MDTTTMSRCSTCGELVCSTETCSALRAQLKALIAKRIDGWLALPEDSFTVVMGKAAVLLLAAKNG